MVERGSLDRPLANEHGVFGALVRLREVASSISGIVRVASTDEEVDMSVEDDVGIDVGPVLVPCLGTNEAIGESNRHGGRSLADLLESGSVVLVEVGDRVLGLAKVV